MSGEAPQQSEPLPFDNLSPQQPESQPLAASPTESLSKFIDTLRSAIALILALGTFLTATGFVIVNFHLSNFTDVHSLSVNPNQYFTAAAGLFVFIIVSSLLFTLIEEADDIAGYLIEQLKAKSPGIERFKTPVQFLIVVVTVTVAFVFFVGSLTVIDEKSLQLLVIMVAATIFLHILWGMRVTIIHDLSTNHLQLILLLAFFVFYVIVVGYVYSTLVYPKIPHFLGGGQPATIILVFKDDDTIARLGIVQDPSHPKRTQNVLLLADLADGLLVLDPASGQVIAVKNESILGIYDDKVNTEYLATATPTFTPSPTLSPTPTSTASPAATIPAAP